MTTMIESTVTPGTFTKSDIPDSYFGKVWDGAMSQIKGEALAPEVSQPAAIGIFAAGLLTGDYLGVKAGREGKGYMIKLRKA